MKTALTLYDRLEAKKRIFLAVMEETTDRIVYRRLQEKIMTIRIKQALLNSSI